MEMVRLEISEHADFFIPKELIVGKKLHPMRAFAGITIYSFMLQQQSEVVSLLGIQLSTPNSKVKAKFFFQHGENDVG